MVKEINKIMEQAYEAWLSYQKVSGKTKKDYLYQIAAEIEALGDVLLQTASEESNLPVARFIGESARTCGQLRAFGDLTAEGSWLNSIIDSGNPKRKPVPKPDMRMMSVPIGPVLVFGASNFPLAYSTAGGDTASALAAGCPVIVKGHPSHPQTSNLVANAIIKATKKCGMPTHVFQHVEGTSFEIGKLLTQHPLVAAVGFTGSLQGGRAIYDYAQQRDVPIPVFSEMGSINPVVLLKEALILKAPELAKSLAGSITIGVGQFCTNPGIITSIKSSSLNHFTGLLALELSLISSNKMLSKNIYKNYTSGLDKVLIDKGIETVYHANAEGEMVASPVLARVTAEVFLKNPDLRHEIFGPFSLIVVCNNKAELKEVVKSAGGQLTVTLMGTEADLVANKDLIELAGYIAGRIVFNGVPTGVEVSTATVHGGPYPATTDGRFTSVGMESIQRWVRPVCYQDCPDILLPDELKNSNPLGILRKINGEYTRSAQI